jgi:hypothetical protein
MKKVAFFAVAVVVGMVFVGVSFADQNNTGCGLGSIVFEGKEGLVSQICAATFNGTFGNQTFGITSGTSNCKQHETLWANEKLNTFVADNMDNLARDIAKGKGEYLNTLAVLMEIPHAERADLYAKLKNNFSNIYTSDNVSHLDILKNIEAVVSSS